MARAEKSTATAHRILLKKYRRVPLNAMEQYQPTYFPHGEGARASRIDYLSAPREFLHKVQRAHTLTQRLKCPFKVLSDNAHHSQYIAMVLGNFKWEQNHTVDQSSGELTQA